MELWISWNSKENTNLEPDPFRAVNVTKTWNYIYEVLYAQHASFNHFRIWYSTSRLMSGVDDAVADMM